PPLTVPRIPPPIDTCAPYHPVAYSLGLPASPTRRSSDLSAAPAGHRRRRRGRRGRHRPRRCPAQHRCPRPPWPPSTIPPAEDTRDRKSTRLNSSHVSISYAVFCLKKKT